MVDVQAGSTPPEAPKEASVIARWQRAGKPRDPEWLQAVGQALESRQQLQNAIVVYCWLDDPARVWRCLQAFDNQDSIPLPLLSKVLQYFLARAHWSEFIRFLDRYPGARSQAHRRQLCFDAVEDLARSSLSPTDLTREQRERLQAFVRDRVLAEPDWSESIPIAHVGIVLEKIGHLREALAFYHDSVDATDPNLRDLARTRWLAVRKKQALYSRKEERLEKALEIETEVRERARYWQMRLAEVPLKIPTVARSGARQQPARYLPTDATPVAPHQAEPQATGAAGPEEPPLPSPFTLQVRHLRIRVLAGKQISIADTLAGKVLQIDGRSLQIRLDGIAISTPKGTNLTFSDVAGSYRGTFLTERQPPELHLDVQGIADPIVLSF